MSKGDDCSEIVVSVNNAENNGPQPGVSYPLKVQYCGGNFY